LWQNRARVWLEWENQNHEEDCFDFSGDYHRCTRYGMCRMLVHKNHRECPGSSRECRIGCIVGGRRGLSTGGSKLSSRYRSQFLDRQMGHLAEW
jgi:hypothetical protein